MDNQINFTDNAVTKVRELIEEEGNPELKLRVSISGGGCSGFQYGFSFDEITNDDDFNPEPPEFKEISKEVIQKTVEQIDAKLSGNEKASTKAKAKLRYIKQNFEKNLEKEIKDKIFNYWTVCPLQLSKYIDL